MKKIFSFLLLGLLLSIGNAWADSWVKTNPSDLQSNDVVVIVDLTQNKAMSNDKGTANPPSSVGVTLNQEETEITSTVTANIQWTLVVGGTQETPTYQFWNGNSYLYVTATNNGVRVGSGERNTFTIVTGGDNNGYYLYNSANNDNRFVGDYNGSNWRCYGTINNNIKVNNNAFFKKVIDENACATPTFSVDEGYYSSTQNVEITCATEGATIHYTLNGSEPTENSTTYSSAIAISETTTIKAIAVKANYTNSSVASATYNIVTVQHAGTAQDPYTVADARNAIDLGTGLTGVYATGIVSEIVDDYSTTFYNITFDIIDEGGSDVLRAYRCGGAEAANVEVGDTVVVSGTLVNYNSVYEFSQGCQIVSLKHPVAPAVPSIDVEETSINATAEEAEGTITVTYNNITNVAAEVYFCNAAGTEAVTYDWVDAEINASNNVDYLIEANTGAARTAYMKVWAYDDEFNAVYSEIITISQDAYVAPFVITDGVFDFDQNEDYGSGLTKSGVKLQTSTWTAINVTMVMAGRNCWNDYSGAVSQIRLYKASGESPAGNITFSVPEGNIITNIAFTGATLNKMGAEEGTYVVANDNKSASWHGFANSVLFTATERTDIYTIEVTYAATASLTLGANGYSTFAAPFKYTVSGATAYKAKYVNGAIVLTQVAGVVAGEGIILKGTEGATATIIPSNAEADDFTDNELVGVLSPIEAEANYYVLATIDQDGITKFHPCNAGITIPANKAFIEIGEATAPSAIRIEFAENNATNIMNVDDVENAVKFMENGKLYILKNGVVYDAMGKTVR